MKHALSLIVLVACGDNAATPDARIRSTADAAPPTPHAAIVAGDFMTTGILSTLDVDNLRVTPNAVAGVAGDDPFLRRFDDKLYVINRAGNNNITILDAATLTLIDQLATGPGSNPQDVAVVGDKLYVPALGTAGVVVTSLNPGTPTTIDLATAVGDPDGKPDCVSAYAVGTDVFVACDLLDANFVPRGPGKVAVIDTTTDTVRTTITLPFANPQNMFVRSPMDSTFGGDLLIATVPDFQNYSTGCLARVPVAGGTSTCGLTNAMAHGFQSHSDVYKGGGVEYLVMAVGSYDASFNASGNLQVLDLQTGSLWAMPLSATGEVIVDVAACPDGTIIAADHKMNASGLRVFTSTHEITTTPLSIGMPPSYGNNLVCYDR